MTRINFIWLGSVRLDSVSSDSSFVLFGLTRFDTVDSDSKDFGVVGSIYFCPLLLCLVFYGLIRSGSLGFDSIWFVRLGSVFDAFLASVLADFVQLDSVWFGSARFDS